MKVLILLLVTIVLLYICVVLWCHPRIENLKVSVTKDDILSQVDNGDLVFLSGRTFAEKAIKLWTGSYVSHVGLIVREVDNETGESIPYIFEADYGGGHKDGIRLMKLKDKLDRYKGDKIGGWRRWKGRRPTIEQMLSIVGKYTSQNYTMDPSMLCWIFSNRPEGMMYRMFRKPGDKTIFCSELVIMCLRELKMIQSDEKIPTWYSPNTLAVESFSDRYEPICYFSR